MRRTTPALRFLPLAGVLLAATTGCSVPHMVRQVTPAAVDSGVNTLDDPVMKEKLHHLMASPEMKQIEQDLISGILDGTLSTLDDRERAEKVGVITARYTGAMMRGVSREMSAAFFNAESEKRMRSFVGSMVQASVEPVMKSLSDAEIAPMVSNAMTQQVGPALQKVLRDNLGPGIAQALDSDEVRHALGGTAHVLGQEMILGANEALAKIQKDNKEHNTDRSLLGSVSLLADQGVNASRAIALGAGVIALVLGLWVAKLLLERKRSRADAEERAATTRMLADTMRMADGKPWREDMLDLLEKRFRDDEELLIRINAERKLRQNGAAAPMAAPRLTPAPVRHISTH